MRTDCRCLAILLLSFTVFTSATHCAILRAEVTAADLPLVPYPRSVSVATGEMSLTADSRIVVTDERLAPLADVLAAELLQVTGLQLPTAAATARPGDIVLAWREVSLDPGDDDYELTVDDRATVVGGSYRAVAHGTVTLLQALRADAGRATLPRLTVADGPKLPYCGAMLDLARKPYSIATLRQCVDVCRFHKIRYLQLHMTDENAWTFPSTAYPKLGSQNFAWAGGDAPRRYDVDELRALVAYADARGVTLVPEIEVPGHSGQLRGTLTDIFGYRDAAGQIAALGVINMVSDRALAALDVIMGEAADIFRSSPYIHIGCDEASLGGVEEMPEVLEYVARHKLPYPHAVFNSFVHRMHQIVTRHGKQMIVWEGAPLGPDPLPKDIIFMPWVGHSAVAAQLVREGYTLINAPWGVEKPYHDPYRVNAAQLAPGEPLLLGATSILWESPSDRAVPYLRFTGALRNEPTWNPQSGRDLPDFLRRLAVADARLDQLAHGFTFAADGLIDPVNNGNLLPMFGQNVKLSLAGATPADEVRYTLDGSEPSADSAPFTSPITLRRTTTVKARRFAPGAPPGELLTREYLRLPGLPHQAVAAAVTIEPEKPGYHGPGAAGLTDGFLAAGNDFAFPGWVGWANDGQPLSITLDLGRPTALRRVSPHFLRSAGGVFPPQQVAFSVSDDGETFRPVATVSGESGIRQRGWFTAELDDVMARYVRINPTPGGDWTFVDEVAVNADLPSPDFAHAAQGRPVTLAVDPVAYTAPGIAGLTDGHVCRVPNFLSLEWLGFDGRNLDATIDLGEMMPVETVGARFMQEVRGGIFIPGALEVYVSDDGQAFRQVAKVTRPVDSVGSYLQTLSADLADVRARYVRVVSEAGGQWTFVDEVFVNPATDEGAPAPAAE
jgi:hexosaminidase